MNLLLYKVGFPTVCLNPEDIDLLHCDPHELLHHHNSLLAVFYNPQMTANTLVTDLIKHHGNYVTQVLETYQMATRGQVLCQGLTQGLNNLGFPWLSQAEQ